MWLFPEPWGAVCDRWVTCRKAGCELNPGTGEVGRRRPAGAVVQAPSSRCRPADATQNGSVGGSPSAAGTRGTPRHSFCFSCGLGELALSSGLPLPVHPDGRVAPAAGAQAAVGMCEALGTTPLPLGTLVSRHRRGPCPCDRRGAGPRMGPGAGQGEVPSSVFCRGLEEGLTLAAAPLGPEPEFTCTIYLSPPPPPCEVGWGTRTPGRKSRAAGSAQAGTQLCPQGPPCRKHSHPSRAGLFSARPAHTPQLCGGTGVGGFVRSFWMDSVSLPGTGASLSVSGSRAVGHCLPLEASLQLAGAWL